MSEGGEPSYLDTAVEAVRRGEPVPEDGYQGDYVAELAERGLVGRDLPARITRAKVATDDAAALGIAGGDGSINTAAQVAMDNGKPLAVFPSGTLNHLTGALGIECRADRIVLQGQDGFSRKGHRPHEASLRAALPSPAMTSDDRTSEAARLEELWRGLDAEGILPSGWLPNAVALARRGESIERPARRASSSRCERHGTARPRDPACFICGRRRREGGDRLPW